MKSIIALSILCFIAFSCKKDKTEPLSPYIGTWELREYLDILQLESSPTIIQPGRGWLMKYTADTVYQYRNGQIYLQFDYHIAKDTCFKCYDIPLLMDRLYYKDETEITLSKAYTFQEIKNDTLIIYSYFLNKNNKGISKYVQVADQ